MMKNDDDLDGELLDSLPVEDLVVGAEQIHLM
jgi:hypothetical protein